MLTITVQPRKFFNEQTSSFYVVKGATLSLEHSLYSIQKWESKWNKPFLSKKSKSQEELLDYIRCMTVTKNVDESIYFAIMRDTNIINQIVNYIDSPMTATYVSEDKKAKRNTEIVTAELIYFWMISYGIPFECKFWHINQLLMLIRVCERKNSPSKMSKREALERTAAINKARRARKK